MLLAIVDVAASARAAKTWLWMSAIAVSPGAASRASSASSMASARSRADLSVAELPSHQPPYSRQMWRTMNSGSSYTGRRYGRSSRRAGARTE